MRDDAVLVSLSLLADDGPDKGCAGEYLGDRLSREERGRRP
jgi:hypothetical protein